MMLKKKAMWGALLIAGLLCFAQAGWCETRQGDFFLSPMFGGHVFEGNQGIDNGPTYGLGLGYQFTDNWGVEAMFNYTDTEIDSGNMDLNVFPMHLDAVYNFMPDHKLVPYVAAGVGAVIFDPKHYSNDSDFLMNYGAGLKYFIYENTVALRVDVRHLINVDRSTDSAQNNLLYTAGLMFNFGSEKPAPAPVEAAPVAVAAPPAPVAPPVDVDSDGDGVPDSRDQCPNTPKGAHVDARGCWVIKGVLFDTNKSVIKKAYTQELDNVAAVIKNNPGLRCEIQGHTDNIGSAAYNQKLSESRANAVKCYLVKKGIPANQLTSKGYGFSKPAVTNNTVEGRALNRRVEIAPLF